MEPINRMMLLTDYEQCKQKQEFAEVKNLKKAKLPLEAFTGPKELFITAAHYW